MNHQKELEWNRMLPYERFDESNDEDYTDDEDDDAADDEGYFKPSC